VFSIVIPPPNVTGSLHIGHMLDHTEIDILTRWHRMHGLQHVYLPGTGSCGNFDAARGWCGNWRSAGSITGIWGARSSSSAFGSGRRERRNDSAADEADWGVVRLVAGEVHAFAGAFARGDRSVWLRLYEGGLIYRDNRLLNWCPVCLTVLSDLEVIHEERPGHLWPHQVSGGRQW